MLLVGRFALGVLDLLMLELVALVPGFLLLALGFLLLLADGLSALRLL